MSGKAVSLILVICFGAVADSVQPGSAPEAAPPDWRAVLVTGNAQDAAAALIQAVPDGPRLGVHYDSLMEVVRSGQGELDLAVLWDACTGRDRWHSDVIVDRRKDLAILQWISQKLWELHAGSAKKALLDRYIGDVGWAIDSGRLKPAAGLRLALYTMTTEQVESDVQTDALRKLFERYASTGQKEVDDYILLACSRFPRAFLTGTMTIHDLLGLLRRLYPTRAFPDNSFAFFRPPGPQSRLPVERETYDDIMGLPLPELHKRMLCPPESSGLGYCCALALARVLDSYEEDPKQVSAIVTDLLAKGLLIEPMGAALVSVPFYGPRATKAHPIILHEHTMEIILNGLERRLSGSCSRQERWFAVGAVKACLSDLRLRNSTQPVSGYDDLQRCCAGILIGQIIPWERMSRDETYIFNTPGEALLNDPSGYTAGTKKFIRDSAGKLLDDSASFSTLPGQSQDRLRKMLQALAALE